jgi:hypothetical protein
VHFSRIPVPNPTKRGTLNSQIHDPVIRVYDNAGNVIN